MSYRSFINLMLGVFCFVFIDLSLYATDHQRAPIVLTDEGLALHNSSIVWDGHNDLPWELRSQGDFNLTNFDFNQNQPSFMTDIPRMKKGGLNTQFWAAYVPCSSMSDGTAYNFGLEQIDLIKRMVKKYQTSMTLALTANDVQTAFTNKKIASLIGVEGGHAIQDSLDNLREFYKLGARYLTLTHNCTNNWADSASDEATHNGLTDFGKEVIKEMNHLGMVVDISHVSAKTALDALSVSKAPLIASHSGAYAVRAHVRNLPDNVLRKVAENNGVVMVVFYSAFLVAQGHGDVYSLIDHIDHIVKIAGIDHVGLGSDFDGFGTAPSQLEDVSKFPYITQGLLNRGYKPDAIKKILGGNMMRVFRDVASVANRLKDEEEN